MGSNAKPEWEDKAARERMCIVTRARVPAGSDDDRLIRFVLDPEGMVVPDVKAVLPGRGAWVTGEAGVLGKAIERRAFARAFKTTITPENTERLVERTEEVLTAHAKGALGLARKAGLIVTGFSKVEGAIKGGKACALFHAREAAPDGAGKLDRLAGYHAVPVLRPLTHSEMGLALGQEHVIHAALLDGPGAARFLSPLKRLEVFLMEGSPVKQGGDKVSTKGHVEPA
ncbi:MAG: RNA-binding protein [Pseudomonadota bacterium]